MFLFLDRDGVLNTRTPGDYVKTPGEFQFEPGAPEAVALLGHGFERIVVVTNQSGIGKGLMSLDDLHTVHAHMLEGIAAAGGRIDAVYCCPHRPDAGCNCRKPAPGMALQAKNEFPKIDFQKSWLVGDSLCDIQLALSLGMQPVLITGKSEEKEALDRLNLSYRFESLLEFARWYRSGVEC